MRWSCTRAFVHAQEVINTELGEVLQGKQLAQEQNHWGRGRGKNPRAPSCAFRCRHPCCSLFARLRSRCAAAAGPVNRVPRED